MVVIVVATQLVVDVLKVTVLSYGALLEKHDEAGVLTATETTVIIEPFGAVVTPVV